MLDFAAPGMARTLRLFRRLEAPQARRVFLRREFDRRVLGRRQRLPVPGPRDTILFVCHGNIMRSALAEFALREALGPGGILVASAGTAAIPDHPADPRTIAYASQAGLDLGAHRARRFDAELGAGSALIFALDRRIEAEVASVAPAAQSRTVLLGGITPVGDYAGADIDDPYTLSENRVTESFDQVLAGVRILAARLRADREPPA